MPVGESTASPREQDPAPLPHQFQSLGQAIGAHEFALFLIGKPGEGRALTLLFDTTYPRRSARTELIAAELGGRLARHALESPVPLCWMPEDQRPGCAIATMLSWAREISAPAGATTGIALPLHMECGSHGVLIYSGRDLSAEMDRIADIQGRANLLFPQAVALAGEGAASVPPVSKRELECLQYTAEGYTSEEIAALLGLSVHTANQYLATCARKLNAVNRMHAVAKAMRAGLID